MKEIVKNILPWLACLLLDIVVFGGFWLWGYLCGRKSIKASGDAEVRVVSVKDAAPKAAGETVVGTVQVPLVVYGGGKVKAEGKGDVRRSERIVADTVYLPDTALERKEWATIPITQKTYADSNYTAWVSGYMPRLDSIEVRRREMVRTQTVTKRNRFNFGIVGGYGYGFLSHRAEPFVGVGVTWNVFK